jgi:hypothetical protein
MHNELFQQRKRQALSLLASRSGWRKRKAIEVNPVRVSNSMDDGEFWWSEREPSAYGGTIECPDRINNTTK